MSGTMALNDTPHNQLSPCKHPTLSETRDTLLPKLLSGEVRVAGLEMQEATA